MKASACRLAVCAGLISAANSALAAVGWTAPSHIQSVFYIAQNALGHSAGDFELQLTSPMTLPTGVSCDTLYITTAAANDLDKKMFAMAMAAQATRSPVTLAITDDPALTAVSGRCSLIAINITQ